ncbi:hypothetical protein YC2023_073748 [Brassica napus]|uniref:Uncharacterized protein n=1 Tax=Brassica campestris TaxID=3711 RepID=M4F8K8_BRACM
MSETRPVPRRESPWGLPEGHREPQAHCCNDRVEDVVQFRLLKLVASIVIVVILTQFQCIRGIEFACP